MGELVGGVVDLEIVRGRDLVVMDSAMFGKGSSDPYVKVYDGAGEKVSKTEVKTKNLNPEWNHKCSFRVKPSQPKTIKLRVVDKDKLGSDDPMGKVEIDLMSLTDGVAVSQWFDIVQDEKGGKAGGQLFLTVTFKHRVVPNLSKGEQFAPEEAWSTVRVGLAWDSFGKPVDLDVSCVFFDNAAKAVDALYFGKLKCFDGAAVHGGDSRAGAEGEGEHEDEAIVLQLHKLPASVVAMFFVVNAYNENTTFGDVETAKVRLVDQDQGGELCRMEVGAKGSHTGLVMCRLARHQGMWVLNCIGEVSSNRDYGSMIPELKEALRDVCPNVVVSPSDKMAVMRKGQSIHVADFCAGELRNVSMGLGWDCVAERVDLDASCILMDNKARVVEIVSFRKLQSNNRSVVHSGDNLTGAGDGDDEVISVNLPQLDSHVEMLFFIVNSFSGHKFTQVRNTRARLFEPHSKHQMADFRLDSSSYNCTALLMAVLRRNGGAWDMKAIGEGCTERTAEGCVDEVQAYIRAQGW